MSGGWPGRGKVAPEVRFASKYRVDQGTDCWLWTASLAPNGAGTFWYGGRMIPATRAAYQMRNGPIPDDTLVTQRCDVRRCVNPAHLELITAQELATRRAGPDLGCNRCGADAPVSERALRRRWRVCEPCLRQYERGHAALTRARAISQGTCRRCAARPPIPSTNYCADCTRKKKLHRVSSSYGLSQEEFIALEAGAGGTCAICMTSGVPLDIDHDHETMVVRGLICSPCNRGLAAMRDDPVRLRAAAGYLERYLCDDHPGVKRVCPDCAESTERLLERQNRRKARAKKAAA